MHRAWHNRGEGHKAHAAHPATRAALIVCRSRRPMQLIRAMDERYAAAAHAG
jgi:hypothetical protein